MGENSKIKQYDRLSNEFYSEVAVNSAFLGLIGLGVGLVLPHKKPINILQNSLKCSCISIGAAIGLTFGRYSRYYEKQRHSEMPIKIEKWYCSALFFSFAKDLFSSTKKLLQ